MFVCFFKPSIGCNLEDGLSNTERESSTDNDTMGCKWAQFCLLWIITLEVIISFYAFQLIPSSSDNSNCCCRCVWSDCSTYSYICSRCDYKKKEDAEMIQTRCEDMNPLLNAASVSPYCITPCRCRDSWSEAKLLYETRPMCTRRA